MTTIKTEPHVTVGARVKNELREYTILAAYLYVCFGALVLYKAALLNGQGISFTPFGVAIVKALILGKFILLGQAAHLGGRNHSGRMIVSIAYKSLLFLLLLIVLSVVEEAIVALFHGETVTAALVGLWGGKLWQILATSLVMLLILVPYIGMRELNESVDGRLWRMLSERRIQR